MEFLMGIETDYMVWIALGMIILLLLLVVVLFINLATMKKEIKSLKTRYNGITRQIEDPDLIQLLEQVSIESLSYGEQLGVMQEHVKDLAKKQTSNINRIVVEHYNAFDFTYGELSFSLAMLDDLGSGIVFTNIHNRDDARCYCKKVVKGTSKHPLSEEEKYVLEVAINGSAGYSRRNAANDSLY